MKNLELKLDKKSYLAKGGYYRDILKDLKLSAKSGSITALIGTSGIGKTTLLRILSGLDNDFVGDVVLNGNKYSRPSRKIGMVFQETRLLPWKTVGENLAFASKDLRSENSSIDNALKLVDLFHAKNLYPHELSGGMQKRAALARAIMSEPEFLLLDEPFEGLDPNARLDIQVYLEKIVLEKKIGVVISTHNLTEVTYLADKIIILNGAPATVSDQIELKLKRPRKRNSEEFLRVLEKINHAISDKSKPGRAEI